ncbi:hypothetical protein B0H17DRAFT_1149966 [Mycena rosella]|uniref:Uncharacterized protein n=1 Tax=Mycena rosella TaxID=1033263 RepID=A0AAD7BVT8_MYCRO|nr:hypothetical protein B0H17DRAFT_1149966 [Mycena rosella]
MYSYQGLLSMSESLEDSTNQPGCQHASQAALVLDELSTIPPLESERKIPPEFEPKPRSRRSPRSTRPHPLALHPSKLHVLDPGPPHLYRSNRRSDTNPPSLNPAARPSLTHLPGSSQNLHQHPNPSPRQKHPQHPRCPPNRSSSQKSPRTSSTWTRPTPRTSPHAKSLRRRRLGGARSAAASPLGRDELQAGLDAALYELAAEHAKLVRVRAKLVLARAELTLVRADKERSDSGVHILPKAVALIRSAHNGHLKLDDVRMQLGGRRHTGSGAARAAEGWLRSCWRACFQDVVASTF